MFRAVIKYNSFLNDDGKKVFDTISQMNITVLKTVCRTGDHPEVTFLMNSRTDLNQLLMKLNQICDNEVIVVKLMPGCLRCDSCKHRDKCLHIRQILFSFLPFKPKCYRTN